MCTDPNESLPPFLIQPNYNVDYILARSAHQILRVVILHHCNPPTNFISKSEVLKVPT